MKMSQHRRFATAIALMCFSIVHPAFAFDGKSLQNVKQFGVIVVGDDTKDGLDREQIKVDVELRLRKAGLPVNNEQKFGVLSVHPQVIVSQLNPGLCVFNISIEFDQYVIVEANGSSIIAPTWQESILGSVGRLNLESEIRKEVADLVDTFMNAYLTENPLKP
jgi:hypothetical protein